MSKNYHLLFYTKKSKSINSEKSNIYLRITINGIRSEMSISRSINTIKWNSKKGKAIGNDKNITEINSHIENITYNLKKIHQKLMDNQEFITPKEMIRELTGQRKNKNQKMLLEIFQNHNDEVEKLIGKDFSASTANRYRTARKHIESYIKLEYKKDDIPVNEVDNKFINGFEYYLKSERHCNHNSTIKYVTNFKKIIRIAYANDWISKDPFFNRKVRLKPVNREFLSESEIQNMIEKEFKIPRLDQVKDIFVFSCFTGLAYSDVKKLSKDNIVIGIDGERWIKTKRTKTDTRSNIPILPTAEAILEKYAEHPDVQNGEKLLPVLSNQKMNAYLKEIADLCEIHKNLTFHLARHTFATTVTLTNGVPIESVSKMLGHKSLKTTQHYAKILDRKVSDDMKVLRNKFNLEKSNKNII